jgi:chromosome segregation ATPase
VAKQVEDIVVRLVGEGFEALDKIKGSFRELGKVTNLAEKDILSARDSLLEYARRAGNTEAVNKGLGDAFKGLRSQVDMCSDAYRVLSSDLRKLNEVSRGATESVMAQRQAVLSSTAAGTQNAAALRQQRAALIALRAQTRDSSEAFNQFSADITQVETRINNLSDVNNRFNSALSRARAGTAAGARAELEVLAQGIALRRQEIADIDLLNKKQRTTPEILRQRLELENQLNTALAERRQLQFQETARTGRESARTGAATFSSADFTGTGYLTAGRISGRLGELPNTTAGLSQELSELNEQIGRAHV